MEIVNKTTDANRISNPNKGRVLSDAVTPNNPRNAGNNPTKQLGHAPPKSPPNIPRKPKPLTLFSDFNFLTLLYIRFMFIDTNIEVNIVRNM